MILMKTKILCTIMISVLLGSTIIPSISSSSTDKKITSLDCSEQCYGFIVPLIKDENYYKEYNLSNVVYNLINDLLREKIRIFWMAENNSLSVRTINSDEIKEMIFSMGSFVIPFSDNNSVNVKIISIVCDYNESNEIEEKLTNMPIFLIMNSFSIRGFRLTEVKIAHYKNPFSTDSEIHYVNAAQKSGFFNFEFLDEKTINRLNKEDFNFFIYGYGDTEVSILCPPLNPYTGTPFFYAWEDIRYGVSTKIRNFVRDGGNYLGCCAGAQRASAGLDGMPFKFYFKFAASHTRMPVLGCLSLVDCFATLNSVNSSSNIVELEIMNNSHPIVYGMDTIVSDFYAAGPNFLDLGKNVEVISKFKNAHENLDGTPSWISSDFGEGKVILSSSHPELMDFEHNEMGCKFLSNSYYYATSEFKENIEIIASKNVSFIRNIWNQTKELVITSINNSNLFDNVTSKLEKLLDNIKYLEKELNSSLNLINKIIIDENHVIDSYSSVHFLGHFSISVVKDRYLKLSIHYMEDTIQKIEMIDRLYSQLEDDNSKNIIISLNDDLNKTVSDLNEFVNKIKSYVENYNDSLNIYQNSIFKKSKERKVHDSLHKITGNIPTLFSDIVISYFKTIKALRNNWYEYETSIIDFYGV